MPRPPVGSVPPSVVPPPDGEGVVPLWLIGGRLCEVGPKGEVRPYMGPLKPWFDLPFPGQVVTTTTAGSLTPIADALKAMALGLKAAWKATKHELPLKVRLLPIGLILQIVAWVLPILIAWLQRNPAQVPALLAARGEIPPAVYAAVAITEEDEAAVARVGQAETDTDGFQHTEAW